MFGGPTNNTVPPAGSGRDSADAVARIQGNLTHAFVSGAGPDGLSVFVNGQPLLTGQIESLSVDIIAPDETGNGRLTGILSHYDGSAAATRTTRSVSLFPGTVEVIAKGRRIAVTCAEEGSFDGLVLRLGMDESGIGLEAQGVKSLRLLVSPGLVDARLVWIEDGREENLLPD
jgi:hypothetical protein